HVTEVDVQIHQHHRVRGCLDEAHGDVRGHRRLAHPTLGGGHRDDAAAGLALVAGASYTAVANDHVSVLVHAGFRQNHVPSPCTHGGEAGPAGVCSHQNGMGAEPLHGPGCDGERLVVVGARLDDEQVGVRGTGNRCCDRLRVMG